MSGLPCQGCRVRTAVYGLPCQGAGPGRRVGALRRAAGSGGCVGPPCWQPVPFRGMCLALSVCHAYGPKPLLSDVSLGCRPGMPFRRCCLGCVGLGRRFGVSAVHCGAVPGVRCPVGGAVLAAMRWPAASVRQGLLAVGPVRLPAVEALGGALACRVGAAGALGRRPGAAPGGSKRWAACGVHAACGRRTGGRCAAGVRGRAAGGRRVDREPIPWVSHESGQS
ncbi:hypothetical protein EDD27_7563 [Nonomuraea polychroma]|uniref:Uncharacterized protein n=1 Tax=Nonomuraea polychroma TaxID=46176 RepID=A0A438MG98_9ACTN|nr:hypothetical protein EDD27_7563 [Nonomuraea polychroma]